MKIIDWQRRGNLVRFLIGNDDCNDFRGDDWDDCPYEENAGTVYTEYQRGFIDMAFPFDWLLLEPKDEWSDYSGVSKDELKYGKIPFLLVIPNTAAEDSWDSTYREWLGNLGIYKLYIGNDIKDIYSLIAEGEGESPMILQKIIFDNEEERK